MRQGGRFPEAKADECTLLFGCVLLAGLLSFEDGVFALHYGPAQCTVSQIPNDPGQLADLRTLKTNKKRGVFNRYVPSENRQESCPVYVPQP